VSGHGSDDVGSYSIKGRWSSATGRLAFSKTYVRGTGNQRENLGHTVEYRGEVQQGQLAAGVRGTWYVKIPGGYSGSGRFHLWPSQSAQCATPDDVRVNIDCCAKSATAPAESTHLLQPSPSAPPSSFAGSAAPIPRYRVVVDNECVVCFDGSVNTVLVPCGHVALCTTCARKLTLCPICRASIDHIMSI
jgi:hypothetical protein